MRTPERITTFTRANLHPVHAACVAALEEVGREFGISVTVKPGRFRADSYQFRVEATTGPQVSKDEAAEREFRQSCHLFGLDTSAFGKSFTVRSRLFVVCGLRTRSRKYPLLARDTMGKVYSFRIEDTGLVDAAALRLARECADEAAFEARAS